MFSENYALQAAGAFPLKILVINIAAPSTNNTMPVALFSTTGLALFANLAASLAQINVKPTQSRSMVISGIPDIAK